MTIMFGRKLALVRNGSTEKIERENIVITPYLIEVKHITIKKIKKYSYVGLVTTIRLYFRSSNLLKTKYEELKTKIKNSNIVKNREGINEKEVSGFLKTVSEYKNKIRKIKHQIKEEENLL